MLTPSDKTAMAVSEYCKNNNYSFTSPREAVIRTIADSDVPLGAYDILHRLVDVLDNPKPPTIYRAISFLTQHHFIHRIESLNAYVMCENDHRHSGAQFMICDTCKAVFETHECHLPTALEKQAENIGFTPRHWVSELHGKCKACA